MAADYYVLLEVQPDSPLSEIKAAYRRLARKYHPDVNPANDAKEMFQAITVAYETLSDAEKRKRYDSSNICMEILEARKQKIREKLQKHIYENNIGSDSQNPLNKATSNQTSTHRSHEEEEEAVADFFDSFASIFKEAFSTWKPATTGKEKNRNKPIELTLTPQERKLGGRKEVTVYKKVPCSLCKNKSKATQSACKQCKGNAYTRIKKIITFDLPVNLREGIIKLPAIGESEYIWVKISYS